ncbi:MAG: hypothetical protein JWP78_3370 [Mucilaginibacter sp.]|nr:hypothetical protein [Mucilaginibacter sp.]
MKHTIAKQKTWKAMPAAAEKPLQLPVPLMARLIELAAFDAGQIGGYTLSGATHAIPGVDQEYLIERDCINNTFSVTAYRWSPNRIGYSCTKGRDCRKTWQSTQKRLATRSKSLCIK